jgi:VanZ family protein
MIVDLLLWALTIACASTTLWFSFGAPPPGADLFSWADKAGHGIAYFATTLSFLFAAVWRPGRGDGGVARWGRWFPLAAIIGAILIEVAQGMTPNRTPELADLMAAAIGTTIAVGIHVLIRRRISSRSPRTSQRSEPETRPAP